MSEIFYTIMYGCGCAVLICLTILAIIYTVMIIREFIEVLKD